MKKLFEKSPLVLATVLAFIFLIPFIVLEVVNRQTFDESFPYELFTFAWFLQTVFILILMPLIKSVHAGKFRTEGPISLVLRVAILILISYIWTGWVIDQWPCLMGIPNCD